MIAFTLLLAYASVVITQTTGKAWETVTLTSDEVILDMNGEWDVLDEFYGPFDFHDSTINAVDLTTKNDFSLVIIIDCDILGDN